MSIQEVGLRLDPRVSLSGNSAHDYGDSIPCFLLVPESQHVDSPGFRFMAIQGDISRFTEADQKLAQSGRVSERTSELRPFLECLELFRDRNARAPSCCAIVLSQKLSTTFQSPGCTFSNDYLRHFGTFPSCSEPHALSQELTSLPVRCRPVS